MEVNWLERHLIPLRRSVPEYEVRRIQAIRLARDTAKAAPRSQRARRSGQFGGYEVRVATPDGKVVGRIDQLVYGPTGIVVRDYKSGAIYREDAMGQMTLKDEYATQLRLYAALVAAMTGEWPVRLEICSLDGTIDTVPFDEDDCEALLREAAELLDATNAIVNSPETIRDQIGRLARPSAAACRFCGYRPICPAYIEKGSGDPHTWPRDVIGMVSDIQQLGNGRVLMELRVAASGTLVRVVGLNPSETRHPMLDSIRIGTAAGAFNLGQILGPSSFRKGPLTTIYAFSTVS